MAYQRAQWHSGLTYEQTCDGCKTRISYMDDKLDFRPWYADGFVYCPTCGKPLRHNEAFAINRPASVNMTQREAPVKAAGTAKFCSQCGRAFGDDERFCPACGNKR